MTKEQKLQSMSDGLGIKHHSYSGNYAVLTDGKVDVLVEWRNDINLWATISISEDYGYIMRRYLELVDSEMEKILHPERKIAENLYNTFCDMDYHDYDETEEKEISQLELALSNIKGYTNEEMQTLYTCLSAIYGD